MNVVDFRKEKPDLIPKKEVHKFRKTSGKISGCPPIHQAPVTQNKKIIS